MVRRGPAADVLPPLWWRPTPPAPPPQGWSMNKWVVGPPTRVVVVTADDVTALAALGGTGVEGRRGSVMAAGLESAEVA